MLYLQILQNLWLLEVLSYVQSGFLELCVSYHEGSQDAPKLDIKLKFLTATILNVRFILILSEDKGILEPRRPLFQTRCRGNLFNMT